MSTEIGFHMGPREHVYNLVEMIRERYGNAGALVSERTHKYTKPLTAADRARIARLYHQAAARGVPRLVDIAKAAGVHVSTVRKLTRPLRVKAPAQPKRRA